MEQKSQPVGTVKERKESLPARFAAVCMLRMVCEEQKFSNEAKEKYLVRIQDKRERALATLLLEGCLERMTEIDYIIDCFSKTPVKKMKPAIAAILRVTVYQLRFTDKIPVSAACNEAVIMAKKLGFSGLSGFVNGVARAIARADKLPYPVRERDFKKYCSVIYSMPMVLVDLLVHQYGIEQTELICKAFLEKRKLSLRVLGEEAEQKEFEAELCKAGITAEAGLYDKAALCIDGFDAPERIPGFADGRFYIMDESSMQAVFAAGLTGTEKVLDVCAAPGGKSIMTADLLRQGGTVTSRDLSEKKTMLILENKLRCKKENLIIQVADASVFHKEDEAAYDVVLADVPCSGLGIIGKKPDIKLFFEKENLKELYELQKKILENAARYVKPGGVLIFSTCTLNKAENEGGFEFLKTDCNMVPESLDPYLSGKLHSETTKQGYLQLLPHIHGTDGFFVSRFRKP